MNDPNEKTGTEATTETKNDRAPRADGTAEGELSEKELEGVAGGIFVSPVGPSAAKG